MKDMELRSLLTRYNGLYKEMDDVYHSLARHYGLSDSALWILYILRESDQVYTQSRICEQMSLSKQTVHSALKNLEAAGYLRLVPLGGSRRDKRILLTGPGLSLAQNTVDHIFQLEQRAFAHLTREEREVFIGLFQKYVGRLREQAQEILEQGPEGGEA